MENQLDTINNSLQFLDPAIKEVLDGDLNGKGSINIEGFSLYSTKKEHILKRNFGSYEKVLILSRVTGRPSERTFTEDEFEKYGKPRKFCAFLGLLDVLDKTFLVFVSNIVPNCIFKHSEIYQISNVCFVPIQSEYSLQNTKSGKLAATFLSGIRKIFNFGHYFSYRYDMTLSLNRQGKEQSDSRFDWASRMFEDLDRYKISDKWKISVIQGFVGSFKDFIQGKQIEYFLFSRRSIMKAGTRYNARGIDDDGNVANFVETEQIILFENHECSLMQIRGSVPVYFSQTGMTAALKVTRSYDMTNPSFLKHVENIQDDYGQILAINLLAKSKQAEQLLTESYESHIKNNKLEDFHYEYFDFHHETKGNKYNKVNNLIEKIKELIHGFKFFSQKSEQKEEVLTQKGVIRTNCLDCMDRTNVVQSKVAMEALNLQMRNIGVDLSKVFGKDPLEAMDFDNSKGPVISFIQAFKEIWAKQADDISMQYSGTGSVASDVTRTGKKGFMASLNSYAKSITRFYVGNFEDSNKQDCIDMILGQHAESFNVFHEAFDKVVNERENEFSEYSDLTIFLATWNVRGCLPSTSYDLNELFDFGEGNADPDIIVIGLQEYFKLNAKNIIINDKSKQDGWKELIQVNLDKTGSQYKLLHQQSLVGILTLIYAKEDIRNRTTKADKDVVKVGMAGTMGNKGASIIRFCVDDSSFVFINSHLESGENKDKQRQGSIFDIHARAFGARGIKQKQKVINHDFKFLFGNMNFKCMMSIDNVTGAVAQHRKLKAEGKDEEAQKVLDSLSSTDEFAIMRQTSVLMRQYKEGKITFIPTYRFEQYSDNYDTAKKHAPAWSDRILCNAKSQKIEQKYYKNVQAYNLSDHRPVAAYYTVKVKKINEEKRQQVIEEIYQNVDFLNKELEKQKESLEKENTETFEQLKQSETLHRAHSETQNPKKQGSSSDDETEYEVIEKDY